MWRRLGGVGLDSIGGMSVHGLDQSYTIFRYGSAGGDGGIAANWYLALHSHVGGDASPI